MTKRLLLPLLASAALLLSAEVTSEACSNVIVTPGASIDGSSMISYSADSHVLYGELYFHPAADWKAGSYRIVQNWDDYRVMGSIPQVPHTYQTVGNMNEHQLIIAESTWGGRTELENKSGMIDYGSLIYITLERARTAREAIQIIVALTDEFGYASEGESFSIADTKEAWVMDLIGKGEGQKGILWVARRIPDGYICAHANQARISRFPLNDPDNCLYAPDVISFAREKGWFDGSDEEFSFSNTYCPPDFGTIRGCDARVWSAFNILCDGKFTYTDDNGKEITRPATDWLDYAMGYNFDNPMPLFVKPARKISPKNVADVMRDHFEGTPMDMTTDIGAGGNALPYRWRPLTFTWEGKSYVNERALATQQTGFWFVAQSRGWLPDMIGALQWFGCDDAATSYLTPIYANITAVPECLRVGNGDILHYSPNSTFWICNRVANACYKMYDHMAAFVRKRIDKFENDQMNEAIKANDEAALKLYGNGSKREAKKVRKLLTDYTVGTAQQQFTDWVKLEETLLVKFMDGNVKAQDEDGNFLHADEYQGLPVGLTQPGYTDKWKEAVVKDHGSILEEK